MRLNLIKRRIARLMAFVLIFLMMAQPFSDVYIYADEDIEAGDGQEMQEGSEPEAEDVAEQADEVAEECENIDEEAVGAVSYSLIFYKKDNLSPLEEYHDIAPNTTFGELGIGKIESEAPDTNEEVFKYWYTTNPSVEFSYNAQTKINSNISLFQFWSPLHKVTFNYNYDGGSSEIRYVEHGKGAEPITVSRNGYRFDKWFKDSDCTVSYTFGDGNPVLSDLQLYAGWIRQCTVTFDKNTGESITHPELRVQTVDEGSKIENPGASKPGNNLEGWYNEPVGGTKWDFDNDVLTSNKTLYAHWTKQKRTVSFDSYVTDPEYKVQTRLYGQTISEPDAPSLSGNVFVGWYDDPVEGSKWDFSRGIANNMYLYARFRPVTYRVIFDSGRLSGGVTNMPPVVDVPLDSPIVSGNKIPLHNKYVFLNWYKEPECIHIWDFNKPVKEEDSADGETITLYADWKIKTFDIDFVTNHAGKTVSSQTVVYDDKVDDPQIDKDDYANIVEWYEEAELRNKFDFDTEVHRDYTLYAKWTDAKKVSFDTDGGSPIAPTKVVSGTNILRADIPATTKKGYTFINWYEDLSTDLLWNFDVRNKIYDDVVLYAKWSINNYKVTFVNEGRTLRDYTQTVSYGGLVNEPSVTLQKDGYIFTGWYSDEACTVSWNFHTDTVSDSDMSLYAGWEVIKYTVSFDKNADDAVMLTPASQTVPYNSKLTEPVATRTGYVLNGWYKIKDSYINSNKWNFSTDTVTEGRTLYAYWTVKKCTVRFDTQGGSAIADVTVNYNNRVSKPKDPSKAGCSFNGWYNDAACTSPFEFDTTYIKDDITIYAGWIAAKPFKIKAYVEGSNGKISPSGSIEVQKGGSQAFLFTPESGYMPDVLKIDGVETVFEGNRYVLGNVQADHTVTISFKKIPIIRYVISSSCADGFGEIEPRGEVLVTEGKSQSFKLYPNDGYVIDYIDVDGIRTVISGNSYTFENVRKGHNIIAHFKKSDPPAPLGYAKVRFIVDGEETSRETVSIGQTVKRPADPEKSGFIFMGWYDGNWKWNFADPVERNLELEAKFISQTVSNDDVHSGMDDRMNLSDPDDITMVKGQSYDFGPGIWSSSNKQIISIKKKTGVAKAKNASGVPVTITNTAVTPNVSYRIKVVAPELSSKKMTMGVGSTQKISVLYSGGLNVAWMSSNPKVASVDEGTITAIAKGKANICAYLNGRKYTCKVTVSDKFTAPDSFDDVTSFTLRLGQTLNLKNISVEGAKPNKLDWRIIDEDGSKDVGKSGWLAWDDGVVRINVNGKLKAKGVGTSTIIGRRGDTRVKTIKVNVDTIPTKTETYINVGRNEKLSYYGVNNKKAYWTATNEGEIVLLGSTSKTMGTVYGVNVGTSVVSCSYNGIKYSTKVHVEDPELLTEDSRIGRTGNNEYLLTLKSGTRFVADLPDVSQQVAWKSKDKKIAFVDENGIIEGRKQGKTTVSAKINGTTVTIKVFVTQ